MEHSMVEIRKEFEELCDALTCTDFVGFLNRVGHDDSEFFEWKRRYWREYDNGNLDYIHFGSGCTRLVLFHSDSKYVFKIQYDTSDPVDYSRNECYVYKQATKHKCEEFFAWTDCLGKYGSAIVYVMERVEVNEEQNSEDSYLYHANQWKEEHDCDDDDDMYLTDYDDHFGMIEYAIAHNGKNMSVAAQLLSDLGVNDLHCANWGYRGDTFVVVDYGGYGEGALLLSKKLISLC